MNRQIELQHRIVAQDTWSSARATSFQTPHGLIHTPIFMPVATRAALRGVDLPLVDGLGFQVLLANTFHLLLRPGAALFKKVGGIHKFMDWPRAVLTDSGGFQIFSLATHLRMSEEGALFRSYIDGEQILLTPEKSIQMQAAIGSDIMMALDHCIDSTSPESSVRAALELTTRWAVRSFKARCPSSTQALFGIVQGACSKELRRESVARITEIPFDGFALGGLAVGEGKELREEIVEYTAPLLPVNAPRYLMGVGTPIDLLEAVKRGVDMFDCILPTSLAHQGVCFTTHGKVDLRRGIYKDAIEPIDRDCPCSTCARFSRAYLHHLVRSREFVVDQLLSIHNLYFYQNLVSQMRTSIIAGKFREFYLTHREPLAQKDPENPPLPPKRRATRNHDRLGDFEVVRHPAGYGSVRHTLSGETMHSVNEPVVEARTVYLEQSGIVELLATSATPLATSVAPLATSVAPLTVWDVGLGAATNAMALISFLEGLQHAGRQVQIMSFENNLDSLRLALRHPALFAHLRHQAPSTLLRQGAWQSADYRVSWTLFHGDFLAQHVSAPTPELIWYDPFSYKVDTTLWSLKTFQALFTQCRDSSTRLFTYSTSTAVRAALLAAGWYVGRGVRSGPKEETTIAYSPLARHLAPPASLLDAPWLERWSRSEAKAPLGSAAPSDLERVPAHPQFE